MKKKKPTGKKKVKPIDKKKKKTQESPAMILDDYPGDNINQAKIT